MKAAAAAEALDHSGLRDIYRVMVRIAEADAAIQRGLSAGEIQFQYYPCGGQEAIAAALSAVIRPDDHMCTTYRGIHDIVAKGTPLNEVMAELYGRAAGTCKGKGGPMHLSDPASGLMVTTGIVGGGLPIANGLGLAAQLQKTGRVTSVSFGDGATSIGAFHEALNLAALWQLPVVFICQNNQYAEYTSLDQYTRSKSFAARAEGYGMPGIRVDGGDAVALYESFSLAFARARSGAGPTLVEAVCHRLQGHAFGSDQAHMDRTALKQAIENAPLKRFRKQLLTGGAASEQELDAIVSEERAGVDAAIEFARQAAPPAPEELYVDVFGDPRLVPDGSAGQAPKPTAPRPSGETKRMTLCEAINHTLDLALSTDERVFLLGEDLHDPAGGVVKQTYGLSTKHGIDRVRPTPIAEQAIVGAAIGAAMAGMRPVPEIMINDFLAVCLDQVTNHAAKLRYMSGGRTNVPLVIRTITAGNVGSFGAQHSQSLEAWLTHTPGLKVVYPSTPADAKGLLLASIDDEDPVVFFESMRLYFTPGEVPLEAYRIPLGLADVKREGSDISILSWGWACGEALAAAATLADEGISAEVVDLRSLVPLDRDTILESVSKTGRALIAHSAVEFGGFGGELAAMLQERLHGRLKAPVGRVGAAYTPIAFAQGLEALHFPNAARIAGKARSLLAA